MKTEVPNSIKLPVKDLAKKIICDGHLYLSIGKRRFYLMKPGFFVDPAFIKKHAPTNQVFDFETVINEEVRSRFSELFRELRYLQFEKDLREKSQEILSFFSEAYSRKEHFLNFALACHEAFCQLPFEEQLRMHETDTNLYRKALYSSAFSIISGMCNDYYQYLILKDFYNLTFVLDIGLCDLNYSYFVAQASNEENKKPGSGLIYLQREKASEFEVSVFLNHPEKSYEILKNASLLSYPELSEVALYQHELSDGTGFPRHIKKAQVSGWEAVVIFSDSLVEILPEFEFESGVLNYLLEFQNEKLNELPVNRVYRKVFLTFDELKKQKENVP